MSDASSATLDKFRIAGLDDVDDNGELIVGFGEGGARLRAVTIKISKETSPVNEDMSRTQMWRGRKRFADDLLCILSNWGRLRGFKCQPSGEESHLYCGVNVALMQSAETRKLGGPLQT